MAERNTAAAETSLIILIFGFIDRSIWSATFSIAVFIPSATNTSAQQISKKSHSYRLTPNKKPIVTTLKKATSWNLKLFSFFSKNLRPANAGTKLFIILKNFIDPSKLKLSFKCWILFVSLYNVHLNKLMKKGGGTGPLKPWQPILI